MTPPQVVVVVVVVAVAGNEMESSISALIKIIYNILCAYTKKQEVVIWGQKSLWPLSSFFCGGPKKELFRKILPIFHKLGSRRFDWGLALNPIHAFIALSRKVYYITNELPPPSVTIQERWLRRRRKKVRMWKKKERENLKAGQWLSAHLTHTRSALLPLPAVSPNLNSLSLCRIFPFLSRRTTILRLNKDWQNITLSLSSKNQVLSVKVL